MDTMPNTRAKKRIHQEGRSEEETCTGKQPASVEGGDLGLAAPRWKIPSADGDDEPGSMGNEYDAGRRWQSNA